MVNKKGLEKTFIIRYSHSGCTDLSVFEDECYDNCSYAVHLGFLMGIVFMQVTIKARVWSRFCIFL